MNNIERRASGANMPRLNTCLNKDMFIVTATSARQSAK